MKIRNNTSIKENTCQKDQKKKAKHRIQTHNMTETNFNIDILQKKEAPINQHNTLTI
jgi:hypothetical protein